MQQFATISCKRYTGQEDQEERASTLESLPDILLTNYMMRELILELNHRYHAEEEVAETSEPKKKGKKKRAQHGPELEL